ncbi:MAG: response regulator [Proteobacteria bacterium]|nr:response regulator [Pseudomonadota bacterium]
MKNKIIVCGDNNKILENISSILQDNKIKFDIAYSYKVLLDLAKKQKQKLRPYNTIVADLHVNKESGRNYFEQIVKENPESKIIALYSHASYTSEWLNDITKDSSNIMFIKKPFDDIEFIQAVKLALECSGKKTVKNKKSCCSENMVSARIDNSNKLLLENIAHEVRTPLAGIVGIADILKQSKLADSQLNKVKSISQSADALLNIITDLINFEDLKFKPVEIKNENFCFTDLIEGCVKLICVQSGNKELDVNLYIGENVPTFINSDEAKLRKIIWTLLSNAIKYTNYGNVTIFCDYEEAKKGKNNNLIIKIKDTGIGIDEKSQKSLFTKFTETGNAYRSGGSGIGLSMAKLILDAFKGTVDVHSVVDEGSIFTVEIPVATVTDESLQLGFGSITPLNEQGGIFICANKFTAQAVLPQFEKQNCFLYRCDTIRKARIRIQQTEKELKWCLIDDSVVNKSSIPLLKNLILTCKQNDIKPLFLTRKNEIVEMVSAIGGHGFLEKPCLEKEIRHKLSYHSDTLRSSSFAPSLIPVDKLGKGHHLNVLLVEDNEISQMIVSDILKRKGHKVEIARHGKVAVDKASMNKYDVILMDLQMPIMNGIEATKHIRNLDNNTPIVGMTSNIAERVKDECKLAGMDKYLTKPVTSSSLMKAIDDIIDL